jgi:CCR4-NOT complex subunit CAF16
MAPTVPAAGEADTGSMVIRSLAYSYPGGKEILSDFSLELPPGSRCLLSGANGAGKTTLLQILAGKTMVGEDVVRVIGKPPFHDIALTCSGDLGYLGSQWRRNIGSAVRVCERCDAAFLARTDPIIPMRLVS